MDIEYTHWKELLGCTVGVREALEKFQTSETTPPSELVNLNWSKFSINIFYCLFGCFWVGREFRQTGNPPPMFGTFPKFQS